MLWIVSIISFVATTLGAISGIGGGVIIKPVMDAVSGLPVSSISFLSGCTVLSMSVVSVLRARKDSTRLEPRRGTLLAVSGAVGGVVGKQIFDLALRALGGNNAAVGLVQNIIMVFLTCGVLVYVLNKSRIATLKVQNAAACMAIGAALGLMSSFLGIGGGPINLVVLYFFFSMDTKSAALHSLYIILLSQSASLALTVLGNNIPAVDPAMLLVMVLCGVAGGFLGRKCNRKMSMGQVDKLFQVMLVVIIAISAYNLVSYGTQLM